MAGPRLALVAMCFVSFFSYLTVGMLAPFLPQHLEGLDISSRWSGVIFAFYPIAVILTTPAANAAVVRYGRPPLITAGLLVQGLSAFAFGAFGDRLAVLLLTRFTQGCGASASNLAMFALVADLYDESIGKVMGLNELCIGAGFSAGPLFGALLYQLGGFPVPFVVCAVLLVVLAGLSPALGRIQAREVMKPDGQAPEADAGGSAVSRLWAICTVPLLAPAGLLLMGTVIWGIIDSGFYTVHAAHDLGMGQTTIGVNLAAASAAYAAVGPLAGMLADRVGYGVTMFYGALLTSLSLVLLGPAGGPGAELVAQLLGASSVSRVLGWWEFWVLVLLGTGQAALLIPSLGAMKSSVAQGSAAATEACISLFNGFQQGGLVVGPLASAALGSQYNLGNTVVAVIVIGYSLLFGRTLMRCGRAVDDALLSKFVSPKVMVGAPGEFPTPELSRRRSRSGNSHSG